MNNDLKALKHGVRLIDVAEWQEDKYGVLNLYVPDSYGRTIHAWMVLRPQYCDRGHIQLNIDGISLGLDGQDQFPRYFFSPEEANHHCRTFLKWRLWKHRVYDPGWGELEVRRHQEDSAAVA